MLYATDGIHSDDDFDKAMVGVASVWHVVSFVCSRWAGADYNPRYEGNP